MRRRFTAACAGRLLSPTSGHFASTRTPTTFTQRGDEGRGVEVKGRVSAGWREVESRRPERRMTLHYLSHSGSFQPMIFGIGLDKTGTTTLGDTGEILGLRRLGYCEESLQLLKAWRAGDIDRLIEAAVRL